MNDSEKALGEAKNINNREESEKVDKVESKKSPISSLFSQEDIFKLEHNLGEVGKNLYRDLSEKLSQGFMDSSFEYANPMSHEMIHSLDEQNSTHYQILSEKVFYIKKLDSLHAKGMDYQEKKSYKEAKICFEEYLGLAQKCEENLYIMKGLIDCAQCDIYLGNYVNSMASFINVLNKLFNEKEKNDKLTLSDNNNTKGESYIENDILFELIVKVFLGISDIYSNFKHNENALVMIKQGLIYAKLTQKKDLKAQTLLHLLPILFHLEQYNIAHKITKELIELLNEGEKDEFLAEAYVYQGELLLKNGLYKDALEKGLKAHELSNLAKNTHLIGLSLALLGRINAITNNLDEAIDLLEQALSIIKNTYSHDLEKEIKHALMSVYDKKGKHKEILEIIRISDNEIDVNYKDLNIHIKEQIDEQLTNIDLMLDMLSVVKENEHNQSRVSLLEIENKLDGLTKLHNRRALEAKLENAIKENEVASLILMDIDYFKKVNDNFGHVIGDKVLKEMGHILSLVCRKEDFLARYGGEELCVMVNNSDKAIGIKTAERIRSAVEEYDWSIIAEDLKITVSMGVYLNDGYYKSPEDWVAATDSLLYRAKKSGRNRVCFNGEEE